MFHHLYSLFVDFIYLLGCVEFVGLCALGLFGIICVVMPDA